MLREDSGASRSAVVPKRLYGVSLVWFVAVDLETPVVPVSLYQHGDGGRPREPRILPSSPSSRLLWL